MHMQIVQSKVQSLDDTFSLLRLIKLRSWRTPDFNLVFFTLYLIYQLMDFKSKYLSKWTQRFEHFDPKWPPATADPGDLYLVRPWVAIVLEGIKLTNHQIIDTFIELKGHKSNLEPVVLPLTKLIKLSNENGSWLLMRCQYFLDHTFNYNH